MSTTRELFEQLTFAYYKRLKATGWWSPDEGDPTPEALFWRREDQPEMYGVHQLQAAWGGFQLAADHYAKAANDGLTSRKHVAQMLSLLRVKPRTLTDLSVLLNMDHSTVRRWLVDFAEQGLVHQGDLGLHTPVVVWCWGPKE
jgi:DNA-binding transcriptional ArsR family regulator